MIESENVGALKARPKKLRLLDALLSGPKNSFELARAPTFDSCPNSTVSEWRKKGIDIQTEIVRVPGYAGEGAHIARYSLTSEARERAVRIAGVQQ